MTSIVTVKAHCGPTKQVEVHYETYDHLIKTMVLQDGEFHEWAVYDEIMIHLVREVDK